MARRPTWLWPNLLSLDAPLVAVAWFWVFKHLWRVSYTQPTMPWLVALVVWCIYVADRLLDERMAQLGSVRETPRHEFHRRWRRPFTVALLIGILASVALLYLQGQGLITHGVFVLVPVGGYFIMAFYDSGHGVSYFKNILAGMAFAYGTTVGVHFHNSQWSGDLRHLIMAPEVLTFGALCFLNMTAIDHWEESRRSRDPDEKAQYETLLTLLLILLAAFALVLAVRSEHLGLGIQKAFFISIMVAAAALQVINRMRSRFSLDALRVLADVAMLLPIPLFLIMLKFAENS